MMPAFQHCALSTYVDSSRNDGLEHWVRPLGTGLLGTPKIKRVPLARRPAERVESLPAKQPIYIILYHVILYYII